MSILTISLLLQFFLELFTPNLDHISLAQLSLWADPTQNKNTRLVSSDFPLPSHRHQQHLMPACCNLTDACLAVALISQHARPATGGLCVVRDLHPTFNKVRQPYDL